MSATRSSIRSGSSCPSGAPRTRARRSRTRRRTRTDRGCRCRRRARACVRGIMPIGDSVPCGVSSVTVSPTSRPSCSARLRPIRMPGSSSSDAGISAAMLPLCIARWMSVTSPSSAGSMPLRLMNASARSVEIERLPDDRRPRADDAVDLLQPRDLRPVVRRGRRSSRRRRARSSRGCGRAARPAARSSARAR